MVALTLYPFILFAKTKERSDSDFDRETLKHEMVHVRQARSFQFPPLFFLFYLYFFVREAIRWIRAPATTAPCTKIEFWLDWYHDAYHGNRFEIEAYGEEEEELTTEELAELISAAAINFRCLRTGELRRSCKLLNIPTVHDGVRITKRKMCLLLASGAQ
jgi:hypothetical protein